MRFGKVITAAAAVWAGSLIAVWPTQGPSGSAVVYANDGHDDRSLDAKLSRILRDAGFTGDVESKLERRLGRRIDRELADLGRMLWFDNAHSLHQDNTCAGCHSPTNGFGDTQSIAIGVDNNRLVGPNRTGPRNQRRSPLVINTAFLSDLMWNGRFNAPSGDPFDNSLGFHFPPPEGDTQFPPNSKIFKHLLQAQAHIPPTELVEVGGFTGTCPGGVASEGIFQEQCQFDNGQGLTVPLPDRSGFRNEPIRQKVLRILNSIPEYRRLFGQSFQKVRQGKPIDFNMFGLAIAEFEFTLSFVNAPIDRFARGNTGAMTASEKRGALLFFGEAKCSTCHIVDGNNEMFTDFKNRVIGVPQLAPDINLGDSNMIYDGPGRNEDFGLEQITGNKADRYKFRTAPLRNLAVSPAFFHNGAFTRLEDAIAHHLNAYKSARNYNPVAAGVDVDLTHRLGPIEPVLDRLDRKLKNPIDLSRSEFKDLVAFVRDGLLDKRAKKENLCELVPERVPSGMAIIEFEECRRRR